MPKRQLPNTDATRNNALTAAKTKKDNTDPSDIVLTPNTISRLDAMQPVFDLKMQERGNALREQTTATALIREAREKAVIFISHFIQSFNHGVIRGIFPAEDRAFYQIDVSNPRIPVLDSEADILRWGHQLVEGDAARIAAGGAAMGFPSIGELENVYNDFKTLNINQEAFKLTYDKAQEAVDDMREDVDLLILRIWDEVETAYNDEDAPSLRRKARQWGVVYVSSPGEEPIPPEPQITIAMATKQNPPTPVNLGVVGTNGEEATANYGDGTTETKTVNETTTTMFSHLHSAIGNYSMQMIGVILAFLEFYAPDCKLSAINLPEGINLRALDLINNMLTSFFLPLSCVDMLNLQLNNNELDQTSVNQVLIQLDANGLQNGTVNLGGGSNAAPSGQGIAAMNQLIQKGWTVVTN